MAGSIAIQVLDVHVKGAGSSLGATPAGGVGPQLPQFPIAVARFVVQPGSGRGAIIGPKGTVGLAQQRVMYARRKQNGPADTRPWVRLELDRLDTIDKPRLEALLQAQNPGVLTVVSPQFALDLLRGVLTGSVKAKKLPDGGKTIEFNTSISKANRELKHSEDFRDDRKTLLRSLAITGDIFGGVARLRPDGSLQRLRLEIKEQPDKRTKLSIRVDLNMDDGPKDAVSLALPKRDRTIRVGSLAALKGSLIDQLAPEKAAGLPTSLPANIPASLPTGIGG